MNTNDGGPAFPADSGSLDKGMSLRDYFAARAMQAYLAHPELVWNEDAYKHAARASYEIADAMLRAREGKA